MRGDLSPPDARPLRLAFFVHYFPQRSEIFIAEQAAALLALGHHVDVYALWGLRDEDPRDFPAAARAGLFERAFEPHFPRAYAARLRGALRLATRRFAGRRRVLACALAPRHGRWALNLRLLYEAAMLDGRGPYDAVHCQFADLAPVVLRLREIGALDAPVLVHLRGVDITRRPRELGAGAYARLFAQADRVLANCAHFRERALALGCPADKLDVFRTGLDLAAFRYRGPRAPTARLELALVGRLVEKKGIADALQAMARLRERGLAARLRVLGDGPLRGALQALVSELRLDGEVELLGGGGRAEVLALLRDSDLLLAPSVRARDGDEDAPVNTLKEAMALGLPVVATRHGGIPELVAHEENGLLVAEHSPAELAAAIAWLAARRERWDAMGRAGRRRVEAEYALGAQTARLVAIDRALIAARAAR